MGIQARPWPAAWRWGAAAAIAGSLAVAAEDANAAVGPQGIRAGHNITVFHNIDFVATFGHGNGELVRVDVLRGGDRIATARGAAVPSPDGGALEVNHGPAGAPQPGDCWDGATPDVQPGDLIRVSSGGGVDEVVVDDMSMDSVSRHPGLTPSADDDEIWVEGVAKSGVDGQAIPVATLDSGEFRDPANNQLRMEPNEVVEGPTAGTYVAKYRAPFRFVKGAASIQGALDALLRDGHAFGYGHLPLPSGALRPDAMLVDGLGGSGGPALGCEASTAEPSSAGTASTDRLNAADMAALATGDVALTIGGWAAAAVGDAQVELRDAAGATVVKPVTGLTGGSKQQGWSAGFTKGEVASLGQGVLSARLLVGGVAVGAAKVVRHDTVAPAPPTATPSPGTHEAALLVDLRGEGGAAIHYTADGGSPTTASPRFGGALLVDRDTTVRAIAVDGAGNVSDVATLAFAIRPPAAVAQLPLPLPLPELQVLGTRASAARPAVTLRVSRVSAPARLSARGARRSGVVASFVAPAGAEYAEARLYRVTGARRTLVGTRVLATTAGRREVARFTSAATRRKLKAGRYVLEIRTGPALGRFGPAIVRSLRIGR